MRTIILFLWLGSIAKDVMFEALNCALILPVLFLLLSGVLR